MSKRKTSLYKALVGPNLVGQIGEATRAEGDAAGYARGVTEERARCLAAVDAEPEPGSWSDDCVESAKKNIRARIEANPMEAARRLRELAGSMMDGITSEEYIARVRERTEEQDNG